MSKLSALDWNKLLVESQQINASLGGQTSGSVKRGISDLDEATKQFNQRDSKFVRVDDAMRLLARRDFDAESLLRNMKSVQYVNDAYSIQKLDHTDIESFLNHHHDTILYSTINESRKSSEYDFKLIQGRWAADEWSKSKKLFLENLGHKSTAWKSSDISKSSTDNDNDEESNNITQFSFQSRQTRIQQNINKLQPFIKHHISIFHKLALQNNTLYHNQTIVQEYLIRPASELLIIFDPEKISYYTDKSQTDLKSYRTLLDILIHITHSDTSFPVNPGYFAPLCFSTNNDLSYQIKTQMIYDLKHYYEKQILQLWVRKLIDINAIMNIPTSIRSVSNDYQSMIVRSYIIYLYHSKLLSPMILQSSTHHITIINTSKTSNYNEEESHEVSLWILIYHYLRIGNLQLAYEELQRYNITGSYNVLQTAIIGFYYLHMNSVSSDSQSKTPKESYVITKEMIHSIQQCQLHYQQKLLSNDKYYLLICNLLSLANPNDLIDNEIIQTIEDYCWANEWFEYYHRLLSVYSSSNQSISFYDRILESGGKSYYDADDQSPYLYAFVLFSCCRYGDAIEYLWKSKPTEAIHLMLICLHYGLILPHNPLSWNPRHYDHHLIQRNLTSQSITHASTSEDLLTPISILTTFCSLNLNQYLPEISLDYYSYLRTFWRNGIQVRKDSSLNDSSDLSIDSELYQAHDIKSKNILFSGIKSLLLSLDTKQLSLLIGDRNLSNGLYRYFDEQYVQILLKETASDLIFKSYNPTKGIYIYELGLLFVDAMNELCNQLILALLRYQRDYNIESLDQWRTIAIEFHSKYIKPIDMKENESLKANKKKSNKNKDGDKDDDEEEELKKIEKQRLFKKQLSEQNQLYLIELYEMLLSLSLFLIKIHDKKYEEALDIIESLELIPNTANDIQVINHKYYNYDQQLIRLIDMIFLMISDCLRMVYDQYCAMGRDRLFIGVVTDVDEKIMKIKNQTKYLGSLAESLHHLFQRRDTVIIIKRLAVDLA